MSSGPYSGQGSSLELQRYLQAHLRSEPVIASTLGPPATSFPRLGTAGPSNWSPTSISLFSAGASASSRLQPREKSSLVLPPLLPTAWPESVASSLRSWPPTSTSFSLSPTTGSLSWPVISAPPSQPTPVIPIPYSRGSHSTPTEQKEDSQSVSPTCFNHLSQWLLLQSRRESTPHDRGERVTPSSSSNGVPPKKRHLSFQAEDVDSLAGCPPPKLMHFSGQRNSMAGSSGSSSLTAPTETGVFMAHLHAPLHYFRRGGKVRMDPESPLPTTVKGVEELSLMDFLYAAATTHKRLVLLRLIQIRLPAKSPDISSISLVRHIDTQEERGNSVFLNFVDLGSGKRVELQLPYPSSPLFTCELGWCSCDPQSTVATLDVPCSLLQTGLTCLSVLEQANVTSSSAFNDHV